MMEKADYPGLYQAADAASLAHQRKYLWFFRGSLLLLVCIAALGIVREAEVARKAAWGIALLAGTRVILTLVVTNMNLEVGWWDGRAIAESVKTASWRYMMRATPYSDLTDQQADDQFPQELSEIRGARKGIHTYLAKHSTLAPAISTRMRTSRALGLDEKRLAYIEERVEYEKRWYLDKSRWNKQKEETWFWISIVIDLTAVLIAVLQAATGFGSGVVSLYGLLSAVGGSILGWTKVKRFSDLATSYQLAAQELNEISERLRATRTESEFVAVVEQAEGAISREHTMWYAKYR